MSSVKFLATSLALGGLLPGCMLGLAPCDPVQQPASEYVLVEHQAEALVGTTPPAEVNEASTFAQIQPSIKTIGLRFPDTCLTESAARATGTTNNSRDIMGTSCGVWLAELERALTDQRYKVISWSAIRQEQDTKQISTYQAARSLGADVVLVVNSMETHSIKRGGSAGALTRYFKSDKQGTRGEKLFLPIAERRPMNTFAASHAGKITAIGDIAGWAATLDVTAVLASTGESIWFFRRNVSRAREGQVGMRFLFRKEAKAKEVTTATGARVITNTTIPEYVPVRPEGLKIDEPVERDDSAAEDRVHASVESTPQNPYQAEEHQLARDVTRECVRRFSGVK